MVGQLKLAVVQSLQSPGNAQPLLDQPLQLPHRSVGAAIEVQLLARQGEKVKAKCAHAEMAACTRRRIVFAISGKRRTSRIVFVSQYLSNCFQSTGNKGKRKTISLVRRFSAQHTLLDFAAYFRICNEQLLREVISLLWVLLGFVCAFWLAVQLLLPQLRRRHRFARKDLRGPNQLCSFYGE